MGLRDGGVQVGEMFASEPPVPLEWRSPNKRSLGLKFQLQFGATMPPSSAGFASNNSVVSTRTGTAGNVDGSTMSFAGAGVGSRARSAGSRGGPKSKGVELMSNTHDVNVLRDSAQYRAEVEIEFQHLRKLLEIFQKVSFGLRDLSSCLSNTADLFRTQLQWTTMEKLG